MAEGLGPNKGQGEGVDVPGAAGDEAPADAETITRDKTAEGGEGGVGGIGVFEGVTG